MKVTSFIHNGKLSILLAIPLTYLRGVFQLYKIDTMKLPILGTVQCNGLKEYTKFSNYLQYTAISEDGEYYIELTETEVITCKGFRDTLRIYNPVQIIHPIRIRPSCGLALFTSNTNMMKHHCTRNLYQ